MLEHLSSTAVRRAVADFQQTAVPIRRLGIFGSRGRRVPLAILDARNRPDLADLPGVHRREAATGESVSDWRFIFSPGQSLTILTVQLMRPARCRFALVFSLSDDAEWLGLVAQRGCFVIACDPIETVAEMDRGALTITLDVEPLADALARTSQNSKRPSGPQHRKKWGGLG